MATQPETVDIEDMDLDTIPDDDDQDEAHEPGEEGDDRNQSDDDEQDDGEESDDDADVVTFGGQDGDAEPDNEGMRNLRNRLREVERENRQLRGDKPKDRPAKPELDDYWDKPEDYERDLLAWHEGEREAKEVEARQTAQQRAMQERWDRQRGGYEDGWARLNVVNKADARSRIEDTFGEAQQVLLIKAGGDNAAAFIAALGNSRERMDKLKALADDPVELVIAARDMAREVQVGKRKPATAPEKRHAGTSGGGGGDQRMAKLMADAERTGDFTKLAAYERQKERAK